MAIRMLSAPAGRIRAILRDRPNSEHEMTLNRVAFTAAILGYVIFFVDVNGINQNIVAANARYILAFYAAATMAIFAHLIFNPEISPFRRITAIFLDIGTVSFLIGAGDDATACLFPLYLWTIFGNGFRFGTRYLVCASAVSIAGFGAVIVMNSFWAAHLSLSGGLMLSLIVLPAYAAVLIEKLNRAKSQAEAASRAKTAFLASLSHELRTPLNSIIGLTDVIKTTPLNDEQRDMADTIGYSGRSLLSHINTILDHSRLEIGQMPISVARIDLYTALHATWMMLSVQARQKSIYLRLNIEANVPRFVKFNERHLGEVMTNLAGNAIKFTSEGGVTISVRSIPASGNKAGCRIEVKDTGIGIDPAAQPNIFQSFTQADSSILDRFGGTGLGLSITKQIVELYEGRIGVISTPGAGSIFWVEWDIETDEDIRAENAEFQIQKAEHPVALVSGDHAVIALVRRLSPDMRVFTSLTEFAVCGANKAGLEQEHSLLIVDMDFTAVDELDRTLEDARHRTQAAVLIDSAEGALVHHAPGLGVAMIVGRPLNPANLANALNFAIRGSLDTSNNSDNNLRSASGRRYRILIAEDNRTNQKVVRKILEKSGYDVTIADDGQRALDAIIENEFDIMFFDINMPVLNGLDAAKLYHFSLAGSQPVPLYALTADASPEMEAACKEAGMRGCVTKPIEARRLVHLIETELSGKHWDATDITLDSGAGDGGAGTPEPVSLDLEALNDLFGLGGKDFVRELADQFIIDASAVMMRVVEAVAEMDVQKFREEAHALRSCSANLGARRIYQKCLEWRDITPHDLARMGEIYVRELEEEFRTFTASLEDYLDRDNSEDIQSAFRKAG